MQVLEKCEECGGSLDVNRDSRFACVECGLVHGIKYDYGRKNTYDSEDVLRTTGRFTPPRAPGSLGPTLGSRVGFGPHTKRDAQNAPLTQSARDKVRRIAYRNKETHAQAGAVSPRILTVLNMLRATDQFTPAQLWDLAVRAQRIKDYEKSTSQRICFKEAYRVALAVVEVELAGSFPRTVPQIVAELVSWGLKILPRHVVKGIYAVPWLRRLARPSAAVLIPRYALQLSCHPKVVRRLEEVGQGSAQYERRLADAAQEYVASLSFDDMSGCRPSTIAATALLAASLLLQLHAGEGEGVYVSRKDVSEAAEVSWHTIGVMQHRLPPVCSPEAVHALRRMCRNREWYYARLCRVVGERGGKVLSEAYTDAKTKVHVECGGCGNDWWVRPVALTSSSQWCPRCANLQRGERGRRAGQ